jgi:hypothetical protein
MNALWIKLRNAFLLKLVQLVGILQGPFIVVGIDTVKGAIPTDDGWYVYEKGSFYIVTRNLRWKKSARKYQSGIRVLNIPANYQANRELLIATLRCSIITGLTLDDTAEGRAILKVELEDFTRWQSDILATSVHARKNSVTYVDIN